MASNFCRDEITLSYEETRYKFIGGFIMKRFNEICSRNATIGDVIIIVFVGYNMKKCIEPVVNKLLDWVAYRIVDLREIIEDVIE